MFSTDLYRVERTKTQARAPPPRLEIEKQKNVIRATFKLFHLYLATFFNRKYHFLCYFLSWAPLEKLKSQKKSFQIFAPPPLRIPGHATENLSQTWHQMHHIMTSSTTGSPGSHVMPSSLTCSPKKQGKDTSCYTIDTSRYYQYLGFFLLDQLSISLS